MKAFCILLLLCFLGKNALTQTAEAPSRFDIQTYLELYYAYASGNPSDHKLPGFVYSHNRHNEINLNLGFTKIAYAQQRVRANLALMAGTYANANLAAEPGVLKNIYEANIGVNISKNKNLWLDAGVFASHIGFESAISKDCSTLTRSLMADNSPYYESGVKITYSSADNKWLVSGLLLNGWQRIQRLEGNNTPAFGHQLTFKPSAKLTFNSSSFIGSDSPDTLRLMRYFHNFYTQLQCSDQFGLTLGFDIGAQQQAVGSSKLNTWYSYALIGKYQATAKMAFAARAEYYSDAHQVIIATGTQEGAQIYGLSINVDYLIADHALWRIEGKNLLGKNDSFLHNYKTGNNLFILTTSLALAF